MQNVTLTGGGGGVYKLLFRYDKLYICHSTKGGVALKFRFLEVLRPFLRFGPFFQIFCDFLQEISTLGLGNAS